MRRDTQNVVLVLLGGALLKIAATDVYLRYVRPDHRWLLLAAGAIILTIAVVTIVRDLRATRAGRPGGGDHDRADDRADGGDHHHCDHHDGDHHDGDHHGDQEHGEHGHRDPRSTWLLVLPVLTIFLVAPPALGADSVRVTGNSVGARPASLGFEPLPSGAAPDVALADFVARAVWDQTGELAERDVTLTGFVVRRDGSVHLARMMIACCAADARPMLVRLIGPDAHFPADQWLRVRARLVAGTASTLDGYTPSVRVLEASPITAPLDPYEF